jgi:hypothetical protein
MPHPHTNLCYRPNISHFLPTSRSKLHKLRVPQVVSELVAAFTAVALLLRSLPESAAASSGGDAESASGSRPGGAIALFTAPQLPADEQDRRRWQLAAALRLVPAAAAAAVLDRRGLVAAAGLPSGAAAASDAAAAAAFAQSVAVGPGGVVAVERTREAAAEICALLACDRALVCVDGAGK